ncbi:UvrD-helicase domain-containing protein [Candidatus Woesearchaeota archaeon]|nr:UvrD-helicase domain-containing protein [Candidatus Woesearchaeota archaeon]
MQEETINEPNHIMLLKAIDELRFKVGRKYLTELLQGKKTERAMQHRFHKNRYFGCLECFTKEEIGRLLDELEYKGLIEIKKPDPGKYYSIVCLTKTGEKDILNEKSPDEKTGIHHDIEPVTEQDKKLFSMLGDFLDGLNDFQKKAVIDNSSHILCVAGAGTGKTKVLTKRIEFLSKLKNVDDDRILAITFTRKARKEMLKRLNTILPGNSLQIETFNSFCEKILLRSGHLIYNRKYKVLDFRSRILLVNTILKEMGHTPESAADLYYSHRKYFTEDKKTLYLRFINDLFAVMDHYRNMERGLDKLKSSFNSSASYSDRDVADFVLKVLEKISQYKKKFGFRDYTDQIVHAMELFSRFPECIPKFDYILVDEYQDVNNMQIRLLDYLNPKNLFAVGDPRQSIFGWRGSDISHIIRFREKYPDCKILELKINYRSKEDIINVLNSVISPMALPDICCCGNNTSQDKNVCLLEQENEEAEHLFVCQSILSLKVPRNEIFVLARTNKQLDKMAEKLRRFKISFIKRTVEEQKQNIDPEKGQVTLSTVHAIKGLEAEVVYLIGANSFSFPCKVSEHPILDILKTNDGYDKYQEELRVFYVALSRARSKLIINYYSTLTHFIDDRTIGIINGQGNQNISRFSDSKKKILPAKTTSKTASPARGLFEILRRWRLEKSRLLNVKAFQILSDKTLLEICQSGPTTKEELYDIHGMGPNKVRRFGEEVLQIVLDNG